MTMKEMHAIAKHRIHYYKTSGLEELVPYVECEERTLVELWKYGTITNFTQNFLAYANGYQIRTGDYENIHIAACYDLHTISANRKAVRELAQLIFG